MTAPPHNSPGSLDLSRTEAWTVHAAVVAEIERLTDADTDPSEAVDLLRTVEAGGPFESTELEYLGDVLRTHAESDAPPQDRTVARRLVSELDAST